MSHSQTLPVLGCLLVVAGYGLCASLLIVRGHEEMRDHHAEAIQACAACLPSDVTLATRFSRERLEMDLDAQARLFKCRALDRIDLPPVDVIISVRCRLNELGAYCRDGEIYAADGRPVSCYTPISYCIPNGGCDHCNLRAYYAILQQRDASALAALADKGHVIVLNPTSSDARNDPDYLKRAAAQFRSSGQSAPDTAASRPSGREVGK